MEERRYEVFTKSEGSLDHDFSSNTAVDLIINDPYRYRERFVVK
jgi:hypothetical protein